MLFGINVPDSKRPLVSSVIVYPIGEDAQVNNDQNPVKLRLILQKDGNYKAENVQAFGKIGFGVSTNDQLDGASNKNGVYQIKTNYNGTEKINIHFEKFSFAETRYLNRYIDYEYWMKNRSRVQKLFREANNPLSIIKNEDTDGYIDVQEGFNSNYTITITDFEGNKTSIVIPIEGKKSENSTPKQINKTDDYIYSNQATSITKGKYSVYIPANSLYEDSFLAIDTKGDTLHLHEDHIPIHKNITITADISNYKTTDKDKLYIGRLNYYGKPYYNTTYRKGDKLSAKTRTFGTYVLASDTTGPTINPINFDDGKWISSNKTLELSINDDLSGISSYRATINGKFILMEYDYKKDVIKYNFDDNIISETENNLKVIVTDNVGNSTTFEATFFRKQ